MNELFQSAEGCLLQALGLAGEELLAGVVRAGAGAEHRPEGLRRALSALLGGLAEDPALARAAFVEALAAGPEGVALRVSLRASFARALALGLPERRDPLPPSRVRRAPVPCGACSSAT